MNYQNHNYQMKRFCSGIITALMALLCLTLLCAAAVPQADAADKEILSPEERLWLNNNLPRIVIAFETSYAPFSFLDAKQQHAGLTHEYLKLVETKLGVTFKRTNFASLEKLLAEVRGSRNPYIVNALTNTSQRAEYIAFTDSFISIPNVIIVQKDRAAPAEENGFSGLRVSLVKSYAVTEHLTGKNLNFTPDLVSDDLSALLSVSFGRSDAAVLDLATASYLIQQKGITNLKVSDVTSFSNRLAMGASINEPVLRDILQKGLAAITDAERKEIRDRWIQYSNSNILSDWRFWAFVVGAVCAICAVIAGSFIWNRTLRREVTLRTEALVKEQESLLASEEELKMTLEQLAGREKALRVSENEFRMLAESVPQIVWATRPDGWTVYFNQRWVDYTGLSLEESYGHGWNIPFHPDDRQMAWDAWQYATKNCATYSLECRLRRSDGVYRWWLIRGVPLLDEANAVIKWFGTCTDIDDLKRSAEEKLAFEHQLQHTQKLESLGVLAGGIAHDFNNILAIIMGNCSLAGMHYESAGNYIPVIEKAAERAAGLCRQMMAYAGKAPFSRTLTVMWMLVDDVVEMLKATIGQNVVIRTKYSPDIPSIMGDASQLRQIVMNLIINASEAIGDKQGEVSVSLSKYEIKSGKTESDHLGAVIPAGGYLCLEVSDNGCGMDDETKRRIFEPFYTTKFTGRGLGMSAVLGILKAHNGALQLSSQPGKGTTFRVYLPVQENTAAEEKPRQEITAKQWQGSGTVLLVEDEAEVLLVAKDMLSMLGFTVLTAVNGLEALELYQQNADKIALVVTDIGMPVMDGYELFRGLKLLKSDLPIVISSGFGDMEVTTQIPVEEIAGLVSKPYRFEQLREVLQNLVNSITKKAILWRS